MAALMTGALEETERLVYANAEEGMKGREEDMIELAGQQGGWRKGACCPAQLLIDSTERRQVPIYTAPTTAQE